MLTSWTNNKGGGGGDGGGGKKGLQLRSTATQNTRVKIKNTYCLKLALILQPRKAHLTAPQRRCEMLSVD